jgi:hypothetical protein
MSDNTPPTIVILLIMIFYVFSLFWRLYQYHKLENLRNEQEQRSFVNYFDSVSWFRLLSQVLMPFPLIRKSNNGSENKIRTKIIISIIMSWGLFGLLLYLYPEMR